MGNCKIYWTLSLLIVTLSLGAQETSPILIFSPQQTNLGNQNWMISQGEDHTLYFCNNKGLALYNGAHWELYPTFDFSIMRSVKAIGNRVYSGNYMDLGYWEKNSSGRLNYTSLKKTLDIEVLEDLIVAAMHEAKKNADNLSEQEMKSVTGGMPMPPGIKF